MPVQGGAQYRSRRPAAGSRASNGVTMASASARLAREHADIKRAHGIPLLETTGPHDPAHHKKNIAALHAAAVIPDTPRPAASLPGLVPGETTTCPFRSDSWPSAQIKKKVSLK
jgi:hypothetical protein